MRIKLSEDFLTGALNIHFERLEHTGGDALMHQLSGRAEITLLVNGAPQVATMIPGQVLRVPGGTWYRVHTADWAAQYGVTTAKTEHAEGEEPPAGG